MTNASGINDPHAHPAIRRRVLRLSIATAASLALLKGAVGFWSGSLVIIASMIDSMLDVVVSSMNYLSLRASEKPADEEHPYGHGKVEYLAGLFQSVFIAGSAGYLGYEAVQRVISGKPIELMGVGIATMLVSTAATLMLIWRLQRVIRQGGSVILETEALHYTTDVASNLGAAATVALVWWTGLQVLDPIVAFAVAVYILKGAGEIFLRSTRHLMDHRLPTTVEEELKSMIEGFHPSIVGYHAFRTRSSGIRTFVDFHLVFRGNPLFKDVHEITEDLIAKLKSRLPHAEFTVHMDPEDGR